MIYVTKREIIKRTWPQDDLEEEEILTSDEVLSDVTKMISAIKEAFNNKTNNNKDTITNSSGS